MGLLSLAIWLPIAFGVVLLALGRDDQATAVRWFALVGAVASFLVTLPLYAGFQLGTADMQFVENASWIQRFNVNYHLGVDGISFWFVLLTAFINVVVVMAGWEVITRKVNQYMAAFLILSGLMIGVFSALDGLLFYVFFEATLIPMYLIIGIWGPEQNLRGVQVLLVHLAWFLADPRCADLLVYPVWWKLRYCSVACACAEQDGANRAVLRLLYRFRCQGAHVAGAHLVARCACGSAHRRLGSTGCHHAQARRLRFPALFASDCTGRGA